MTKQTISLTDTTDTAAGTPTVPAPLPSRRQFCATACQAASFVAVGALAGCGGGGPSSPSGAGAVALQSVNGTLAGRQVSVPVDGPLSAVGSAVIVQTGLGSFLVAHTGQDAFTALSSTCTHEACEVNGIAGGRYVCPCHGSQYTTSGSVVMGPATRALSRFSTQVSGAVLTFNV